MTSPQPKARLSKAGRRMVLSAVVLAVLGAIALDTTVVQTGSDQDTRVQAFNPDAYGDGAFPDIRTAILAKAVDIAVLAPAVLADPKAAAAQYGTASTTGAIFAVKFTATVGAGKSGIYGLTVAGLPADIKLRIQTGPAINDTVLRDAPGTIEFGAFKNQIEYQDAGAAINRAMKKVVLDGIDTANLTGKTIEVIGAFRMGGNPKNWFVTPADLVVK
jgi:predicted lipoprotein